MEIRPSVQTQVLTTSHGGRLRKARPSGRELKRRLSVRCARKRCERKVRLTALEGEPGPTYSLNGRRMAQGSRSNRCYASADAASFSVAVLLVLANFQRTNQFKSAVCGCFRVCVCVLGSRYEAARTSQRRPTDFRPGWPD